MPQRKEEKRNASQFPRIFYAKHMQPGLVGYENETIYVDLDAIKSMLPSAIGKPVFVYHGDVDLQTLKETAGGYITDSFYNENDGWAWFKILAIDDEVHHAVANNWKVSNAYQPSSWGESGLQNNCPYDRKMLGGEFTHLAIVPNPRYEEACIMTPEDFKVYQEVKKSQLEELRNSKPDLPQESAPMFKFFKSSKEEIVNAADLTDDSFVEFNGGKITVKELTEIMNAKKNDANEEMKKDKDEEDKENGAECFDLDGESVSLNSLMETYRASKKNMKKNDDDKDDKKDDDKKENADEDKKDEDDKDEKKNSKKHFDEVRNAHLTYQPVQRVIDTPMDKLARGKSLFGISK